MAAAKKRFALPPRLVLPRASSKLQAPTHSSCFSSVQ